MSDSAFKDGSGKYIFRGDIHTALVSLASEKRRAVRHSGAVLTYAPTYRPKDGICAGDIDCSIKFCRSPFASLFTQLTARPADDVFLQSVTQRTTYRIPIKPASHFYDG